MARLFGTDGIRGRAGEVVTTDLAERLAFAAARELLPERSAAGSPPTVVIGRDTRPSGPELENAAVRGFIAAGYDVVRLGVVPTPAVAYDVSLYAALGLMISASHNPAPDNGLKLFASGGSKLTDDQEDAIEARLSEPVVPVAAPGTDVGAVRPRRDDASAPSYAEHLLSTVGRLDGLRVVVDGANGSASALAPEVYRSAGAQVTAIHSDADGERINEQCGATHPEALAAAVLEHGADLGVAHDGDADRCILVDAAGTVLSGDQVLGLLALARKDAGLPSSDVLVATVMSNLGLTQAMEQAGIDVVRTAVGDRYVLEAMLAGDHRLGGEQSGHVVLRDFATTGDGLLTALQVMDRMVRTGRSLADLASVVSLLPQVLINVPAPRDRAGAEDVVAAVAAEEAALAGTGRVILRPSGTEPLVRVMVEAPTQQLAEQVAQRLASVVGG